MGVCRADSALEINRTGCQFRNPWKFFRDRTQLMQCREKGPWRGGLDDQPLAFLSDNSIISRQLEFPWNTHSLISAISEQLHMVFLISRATLGRHMAN